MQTCKHCVFTVSVYMSSIMRPQVAIRRLKSLSSLYSRSQLGHTGDDIHVVNMSSATKKPSVLITRCSSAIPKVGVDLLRASCNVVEWTGDEAIPKAELVERVKGVDGLFCLITDKIDKDVLDAAGPSLKAISTMSVGYDHVDVAECSKRGIPVGYTPNVLTNATAELTVSLLLNTSRRLTEGVAAVKGGTWGAWKPLWMCGQGLDRSTVGIIGFGRIGFAVAQRLKPFGVSKFLYSDRMEMPYAGEVNAEYSSLDNLLTQSDFVVCCCALTKENAGMMNSSAFGKMKPTAILVNTSRGGLVNQEDLYEALKSGKIGAAGLDVTTPEPLPTDLPLLTLPNCVIVPDIGSATYRSRNAMAELCAQNIINVLNGGTMEAQVK